MAKTQDQGKLAEDDFLAEDAPRDHGPQEAAPAPEPRPQPPAQAQDLTDLCRRLYQDSRVATLWETLPQSGKPPYLPWQKVVNLLHKHCGEVWEVKTVRVQYEGEGADAEVVVTVRLTIMGVGRDASKSENLKGVTRSTGELYDRPGMETAERRALVRAATYFGLADKPANS